MKLTPWYHAHGVGVRRKYANVPTTLDGQRFDSQREARRYGELRLLEKAGQIRALTLQPSFPLWASAARGELVEVARYVADFQYDERDGQGWRLVVEDAKGVRTTVYKLKRRWFEAQYGITIREV